ncbi:hypothetical protein HYY69_03375 [Candidatus Woesearchaeota archaeon]|nr:hypothetical protein [Candidatus Woesearchaeota archaeon]
MDGIFYELLIIVGFFILLLILKQFLPKSMQKSFCVICGAVSLTWFLLLLLLNSGLFTNKVIIALLLGQSTVGIYYFIEKKVAERFHVFRLPFLLTLLVVAYILISFPYNFVFEFTIIFSLWIIFILLYFFRHNTSLKNLVKKIAQCCRNW